MKLLLVTNLYPPQELGGYGRSMADFAHGLQQRGHQVTVLTSDAPYLERGDQANEGQVLRLLQLAGSFRRGVQTWQEPAIVAQANHFNQSLISRLQHKLGFDAALIGNLDLLGPGPLHSLHQLGLPMVHHMGFVEPPFPGILLPPKGLYTVAAASNAVRRGLMGAGWPAANAPVVYPGARLELFGRSTARHTFKDATGTPLKIAFAGLLMATKGAHTLVEALVLLAQQGIPFEASLAGGDFQQDYRHRLEALIEANGLGDQIQFVGQLDRPALAQWLDHHNVFVFPSIYPEAFGIVQAEAMASGLALVSSGVGGAAELFEEGISGLRFEAGNPHSLARVLAQLAKNPALVNQLGQEGQKRATALFSVAAAAQQLEGLLLQ